MKPLFLLFMVLLCRSFFAGGQEEPFKVPETLAIKKLTPGQEEIGFYIVENIKKEETRGLDQLEVPVIVAVLKSGTYYIMQDAHHSLSGFASHVGADHKVRLKVLRVDKKPNWSDERYIKHLIKKQEVYSSTTEINKGWSFKKNWPKNIFELVDSPLRSIVKLAFLRYKISGKWFVLFFQFYLVDIARSKNLYGSDEIVYSKAQVDKFLNMLFGDSEVFSSFVSMINPKHKKAEETQRELKRIRKKRSVLKSGGIKCRQFVSSGG